MHNVDSCDVHVSMIKLIAAYNYIYQSTSHNPVAWNMRSCEPAKWLLLRSKRGLPLAIEQNISISCLYLVLTYSVDQVIIIQYPF